MNYFDAKVQICWQYAKNNVEKERKTIVFLKCPLGICLKVRNFAEKWHL